MAEGTDGAPVAPRPRRAARTVREDLRAALEQGRFTAHQLSAQVGIAEREVVGHLEHLDRTLRREGRRLGVEPARCEACDYVFADRRRFTRPSRCPKCRGEHLSPPWFFVG